jgi:hypothetical protein
MERPTIEDLEAFFNSTTLPTSIQLGPGEKIIDVKQFVDVHLTRYKAYPNQPIYEVFYLRLVKLRKLLLDNT